MSFSVLSFLNAVFWFNLGLIPIAILQARWKIAMKYSPALLAALAILAGVRVFFPLDSPMFLVIRSHVVLRFLQQVLVYKLFDAVPTWVFAVAVLGIRCGCLDCGRLDCITSRILFLSARQADPARLGPRT